MTAFYPVFLDLRGRRAVVIGGGAVAEQKVRGLIAAGAHVTLVSPETVPALSDLARRGAIEIRRRSYRPGDLAGAWLAIAASDDRSVNEAVWAEAERVGVPLNGWTISSIAASSPRPFTGRAISRSPSRPAARARRSRCGCGSASLGSWGARRRGCARC